MSDQRVPIWAADADLDDYDELNFVIGNYGQDNFEDGALRFDSLPIDAHHSLQLPFSIRVSTKLP